MADTSDSEDELDVDQLAGTVPEGGRHERVGYTSQRVLKE